jgi:uroporphyrinogen-III synthase
VRLLLTRPQEDGARTAAALRALGHEVLLAPLLRIEPIADADLGTGPWAAIVMTSANAAAAVAAHRRRAELVGLPAFAVGARTAAAARALGFADVHSAEGDVAALARLIASEVSQRDEPLLYLAGEDRAADLEAVLAAENLAVHTTVAYRAVAETELPPPVRAAIADGRLDGVLHYSKRSAEAFLAAAEVAGVSEPARRIRHFCLSGQVAAPLRAAGAPVVIAARPDQDALFQLLNHAR